MGINKEATLKKIKIDDVKIRQPDVTYYTQDQDGKNYACDDSILITSYNGYKCIDTNIEWNEELGIYTCTINLKKIIKN